MTPLCNSELARLANCCGEIYQSEYHDNFGDHVAEVLAHLIDATATAYQVIDFRTRQTQLHLGKASPALEGYTSTFLQFMHQHPLINYCKRTGDGSAQRFIDVANVPEFQATPLFNEFFRPIGLPFQLAAGLPAAAHEVVGIIFSRDTEFTEQERQVLNLFRLHATHARAQAQRNQFLLNQNRQLRGVLESLREGVIALDDQLRVRHKTRRAAELLARHFPVRPNGARTSLPDDLQRWITTQTTNGDSAAALRTQRRTMLKSPVGRLRIDLIQRHGSWTLILEEADAAWDSAALLSLGVTPREAEVLLWLAQGKSNPEIAIILRGAPRTIDKHVERILRKLHVETRGAAALRAMEVLM